LLVPMLTSDAPKDWKASGDAKFGFDCSTGACTLRKIWFGTGSAYEFRGPGVKSGEIQLTEIRLTPTKGE